MRILITLLILSVSSVAFAATGKHIDYSVNGEVFEGYYISPSPEAPLVFLVHDWDGLTGYEVKRAGMLAELGYSVFCVDMFGKGVRPAEIEEKKKLTGALYADRTKMRTLLNSGLEAAKAQGANIDNGVAMGYCFGGTVVLELARTGVDMKGFVTFHGGLAIPEGQNYSNTKGKMLVLHGSADTSVTMKDFADLAVALERQGVNHEMITYSGAPHAFTVFGSPRYREDADRKSWDRFVGFLNDTLR